MNLAATRRAAAHVAAVGGHELWLAPLLRRRPWVYNMASWQRHRSAALASWFVVASCQRHSAAAFSYGSAWWCLQRHLIITPIPGGGDEPAPLVSLAIDVTPRRLAVLSLQVDTVAAVVVVEMVAVVVVDVVVVAVVQIIVPPPRLAVTAVRWADDRCAGA